MKNLLLVAFALIPISIFFIISCTDPVTVDAPADPPAAVELPEQASDKAAPAKPPEKETKVPRKESKPFEHLDR